ncbi:MAG: hypothetical protein ACREXY_18090, partial [Gammaproteobacteria bacterium]
MPPINHTPPPTKRGEREFYDKVIPLLGSSSHLWFSVNYIGNGDLDFLLADPEMGGFVVELKPITLDMLAEYTAQSSRIKYPGNDSTDHPLDQASKSMFGLRNYLERMTGQSKRKLPFFTPSAAFHKFTRSEFIQKFSPARIVLAQANSMLFSEDLEGPEALAERLVNIRANPPKFGSNSAPAVSLEQIDMLIEHLDSGWRPPASDADIERGQILLKQVGPPGKAVKKRANERPTFLDSYDGPVIFKGAPGTGKTVRLQEIAVAHARAGRSVLFTTFNKVLASFLEGVMATQELGDEVRKRLFITHVNAFDAFSDDLPAFKGLFHT